MLRASGNQAWVFLVNVHIWFHTAQWNFCPLLAVENYFPFLPYLLMFMAALRLGSHHDHAPSFLTSPSCWPAPGSGLEWVWYPNKLMSRIQMPPIQWLGTNGPRHMVLQMISWSHMTYGNTTDRNCYRQDLCFLSSYVDSSLEKCCNNILMSNFFSQK